MAEPEHQESLLKPVPDTGRLLLRVAFISAPAALALALALSRAGFAAGLVVGLACLSPGMLLAVLWRARRRDAELTDQVAQLRRNQERSSNPESDPVLQKVLDSLPAPLLLIEADRRISFANSAAQALLKGPGQGRDIAALIRSPELLAATDKALAGEEGLSVEFRLHGAVSRHLRARIDAMPVVAGLPGRYLLILDDLTDSERLQEVRSDFVADVSHELRTPLAAVLSIVETLNGAAKDDPVATARFLDLLSEQAGRMGRIVDDLLSLSRIEMNLHRPPEGDTDLLEAIRPIVDSARLIAVERDMTIRLEGEGPLKVPGDSLDLSRLFQNLIDNALKYGDSGTEVTVRIEALDTVARVSVTDRGQGIPREHIPRLTERFYRVDKGRSRAAGGTGLGLAIVKHVLNRHRGRLRIDSKMGEGSTFTVELPIPMPGQAVPTPVIVQDTIMKTTME